MTKAEESCTVPTEDALFRKYHDEEWGVPVGSDRRLFEKVCLEGFQSGLSWKTILHRRDNLRACFSGFEAIRIANYTDKDVDRLAADPSIIRNRRKIGSVINNARKVAALISEFGSLGAFFWHFEPDMSARPKRVTHQWLANNPYTRESKALSKALKDRGWSFVGPTNMYALMQATGIVNDHVYGCPRRVEIDKFRDEFTRPIPR